MPLLSLFCGTAWARLGPRKLVVNVNVGERDGIRRWSRRACVTL